MKFGIFLGVLPLVTGDERVKQVIKIVISSFIGHKLTYGDRSDCWKVNY